VAFGGVLIVLTFWSLRVESNARSVGRDRLVKWEAQALRRELGEDFVIVTPGIRLAGSAAGDQARVVTPSDAIAAGATYLVVGRPILDAPGAAQAAEQIVHEIEAAHVQVAR